MTKILRTAVFVALATFAADVKSHMSRGTCLYARNGQPRPAVLPIPRPEDGEGWQ